MLLSHARHGDSTAYTKVMSRPNTCAYAHKQPHTPPFKCPIRKDKAYRVQIYGGENCNYTCESNNNHTLMEGLWLTTMPPRMYDICKTAPWLQMAAAFTIQCQGNHSRAGGFPKTWSRSVNPSHCATRECHWPLVGPSSKGK